MTLIQAWKIFRRFCFSYLSCLDCVEGSWVLKGCRACPHIQAVWLCSLRGKQKSSAVVPLCCNSSHVSPSFPLWWVRSWKSPSQRAERAHVLHKKQLDSGGESLQNEGGTLPNRPWEKKSSLYDSRDSGSKMLCRKGLLGWREALH